MRHRERLSRAEFSENLALGCDPQELQFGSRPLHPCEALVFTPAMPAARRTLRAMVGMATIVLAMCLVGPAMAQPRSAEQELAIDIFKELIEINTVTATGDTYR